MSYEKYLNSIINLPLIELEKQNLLKINLGTFSIQTQ
jgi:hypothetical protein